MGRKKYERQCKRKFRHENYLTAMHHATQLSKNDIAIYPCGICHGCTWVMICSPCGTL